MKHHSPYCGHCKNLAPHWQKAAETYKDYANTHDFHIGSIDCTLEGDLCAKHAITGYPTMYLYKEGEKVDEYLNVASADPFEPLSQYIEKWAGKSTPRPIEEAKKITDESKEMIKQKDDVVQANPTALAAPVVAAPKAPTDVPGVIKPKVDKPQETKAPSIVPNVQGSSIPLTADSFTQLVTNTKDGWFIKFYAPWCNHCKAMAPAWNEMGRDFRGRLNIGEVNCDVESRLCKEIKIRGYPTLMFFKSQEHIEYDGLRGLGDLMSFATKAMQSGVRDVDAAEFEAVQKKEEVIFLYFYDTATTADDFEILDKTSLQLIGHAPLLKTSSSILASRFRATTFPKLMVIRDGKPQYYTALAPKDMRDSKRILAWMRSTWLPIVPELSAANSHEIMQNRIVVLAALDPEDPQFEEQKSMLKAAAYEWTDHRASEDQAGKQQQRDKKQEQIESAEAKGDQKAIEKAKGIQVHTPERREVGFAWVNGVFWEKWLDRAYNFNIASDGPRIIINEEDQKQYWDTNADGKLIQPVKSEILGTLPYVLSIPPRIKAKSAKNSLETALHAARGVGEGHPFASGAFFLGLLVAVIYLVRSRKGKGTKGFIGRSPITRDLGADREKGNDNGLQGGKFD